MHAYYELEEIKEELTLARQKRAEHLKQCPTQPQFSVYGVEILNDDIENDDD